MTASNGTYETSDFAEAVFLRKAGAIYLRTAWPTPKRAFFVFKRPPDEVLSAWGRGDDAGVRAILDASDFFHGELRRE
jgi:hypothetical protein